MNLENFLLLDASSPLSVVAGTLGAEGRVWKSFSGKKSAALDGVFSALENVCGNEPDTASGFLFCEGPGSILGIRIAAAAIRTRLALAHAAGTPPRPVLAFRSLQLTAALISRSHQRQKLDFAVIAESRMNCWNIFEVKNGIPAEDFREAKTAELPNMLPQKVFLLPAKRALPPILTQAAVCDPAELLKNDPAVFSETPSLLHECGNTPDAVNTSSAESYAKWTPTRHRAPQNQQPENSGRS